MSDRDDGAKGRAKDSPRGTGGPRPLRDALGSVVFHGIELACLACVLDRVPMLGTAFGAEGGMTHTQWTRVLFDAGDFVNGHRGTVAILLSAFLLIDALIMARLWRGPRTWIARLWFTVVAGVPVVALAAILSALWLPLAEVLTR